MTTGEQFISLLILAIPVACVTWTATHEEVFHELREWCLSQSRNLRSIYGRKFFYLLTCEYCFSHHVSALFIAITRFQLLYGGWRGYLISWLSLVWIANAYMSLFGRLRLDIKSENIEIATSHKPANEGKAAAIGKIWLAKLNEQTRLFFFLRALVSLAFEAARTFSQLNESDFEAMLRKTAPFAPEGKFEPFKTTAAFDSTASHPEWLGYAAKG